MMLKNTTTISLHNLEQVREHLVNLVGPHDLVACNRNDRVDFRHRRIEFGRFSFNEFSYGLDVLSSAKLTTDYYFFIFTVSGHISVRHRSLDDFLTRADTVYVVSPRRWTSRITADCTQFVVRIAAGPLHRYLEQHYSIHVQAPLEFTPFPCGVDLQAHGLHQMVTMICNGLGREDRSFRDVRVRGSLEQALIGVLLHEVPHNYQARMQVTGHEVVPGNIRLALDYMHSHTCEPIFLHDVSGVAGMSPRSLQAGFRRYFGVTPLHYLRNLRLDLAHAELACAGNSGLNVTDVALRCGFTDLSKFARYYRERFGQHPSTTLRFGLH